MASAKQSPAFHSSRGERGQNLIEFALLTPVVLVFIAAIVVFGLALNARSSVQQAVREGARQAAVGATLAEVQQLSAGNAPDQISDTLWVHWCHPLNTTTTPQGRGRVGDQVQVYLFKSSGSNQGKGIPFDLVPVGGVFAAAGVSSVSVRLDPVATARLETSVPVGEIDDTCNN